MSTTASDRTGEHGVTHVDTPGLGPAPAPASAAPSAPLADPAYRLYRLSVEQYQAFGRSGILTPDDRVELIEGLVVEKMTRYERHIGTTKRLARFIERALPAGWHVGKEDPIVLARSEPEPDISVLRGDIDSYDQQKPQAADVNLVVEVADSSYAFDRRKMAIYAEAGIPTYWIANLNADRIEVYSEPTGPDPTPEYRSRRDFARSAAIPLVIDGREVARLAVDTLLAPVQPR
ncbi:Uma2 family endonuclease [Tautonia sp. JC769]|uniref:Uma2 family endonuclease n=1 Tax=Tautonia sp. JC769 TaxID=3232135 RepID=UPI003457ABD3